MSLALLGRKNERIRQLKKGFLLYVGNGNIFKHFLNMVFFIVLRIRGVSY
jgi:hypothetical protein